MLYIADFYAADIERASSRSVVQLTPDDTHLRGFDFYTFSDDACQDVFYSIRIFSVFHSHFHKLWVCD